MRKNWAGGTSCPAADGVIGLTCRGRTGWLARYFKELDADETTVRFWQEIYDGTGKLVETHEKFPVDKGHQKA